MALLVEHEVVTAGRKEAGAPPAVGGGTSGPGHMGGNADVAGNATIAAGATTATVAFIVPYSSEPSVVLTVNQNTGVWYVITSSGGVYTGFTIHIPAALGSDCRVNYLVFA